MKKMKKTVRYCLECEGELYPLDNADSHSNPRVCIKILREKLGDLQSKYDSVVDELNYGDCP
jgi:hypothetical protein